MRHFLLLVFSTLIVTAPMACGGGDEDDARFRFADPIPIQGRIIDRETRDPDTCEEANAMKSAVGCEYWPTVTANPIGWHFSYAVTIGNPGTQRASVRITRPDSSDASVTIPPGEVVAVSLPWVESLKGKKNDCGGSDMLPRSVIAAEGAYHLVSTRPVIVHQWNPFEHRVGSPSSERPWCEGALIASNDAALLLPSTAMAMEYRIVGPTERGALGAAMVAITATEPDTTVTVQLPLRARVTGGAGIPHAKGGDSMTFTLAHEGDVAELTSGETLSSADQAGNDFSGSLVRANKPIQVISGARCARTGIGYCDHLEESMLPASALGRHYVVAPPTGPSGTAVAQLVRLVGHHDGTTLSYYPDRPADCPDTLQAGEVVDCGRVDAPFEVVASDAVAIATFQLSLAEISTRGLGDPSMSIPQSVEQFRTSYVFATPRDYPATFVDIVAVEATEISIDGVPLTSAEFTRIGAGPLGVYRSRLVDSPNPLVAGGSRHVIAATRPVGVQVIGYGEATSYQMPAALDLKLAAPPPVK